MRKVICILMLIVLSLLLGCGSDRFDKHMRSGKDALIAKDYDKAVEEFDLALIEKPNDKDARVLMSRAKTSKNQRREDERAVGCDKDNTGLDYFTSRKMDLGILPDTRKCVGPAR